jgi:hypothetical protein
MRPGIVALTLLIMRAGGRKLIDGLAAQGKGQHAQRGYAVIQILFR